MEEHVSASIVGNNETGKIKIWMKSKNNESSNRKNAFIFQSIHNVFKDDAELYSVIDNTSSVIDDLELLTDGHFNLDSIYEELFSCDMIVAICTSY